MGLTPLRQRPQQRSYARCPQWNTCSCCKQVFHGKTFPSPWATAVACPAGDAYVTGMPAAAGRNCIWRCWCVCANMTRLIGAGTASMAPRCQAPEGAANGLRPHRPSQARLQATPRCRCQRHPTDDHGQRCQQARLHDVREVHGCDSSH